MTALRILSFNWHEAYLCLLAKTGHTFSVIDKNKGGRAGWLTGTRPVPANVQLLPIGSEEEARQRAAAGEFDLAICHNLGDLALLSGISLPRIIVFHNRISTEIELFRLAGRPAPTHAQYIAQFLSQFDEGTSAVFISEAKRADAAGIEGRVVPPGIDMDEYSGYRGEEARILRVGNFFTGRDVMLGQTAARAAIGSLPVTVLGINPEIAHSRLSSSWEDLKEHYRSHRVYLNTTVEGYEDGYNLSMLEAMATGMPVVSTANQSSPIREGSNGFVSPAADVLRERLDLLLQDRELARSMGARARETVADKFPIDRFVQSWNEVFHEAMAAPGATLLRLQRLSADSAGQGAVPRQPPVTTVPPAVQSLLDSGAWAKARPVLERKVGGRPESAQLWKALGFVYRHLGREPEAIRAFWSAAKLDPHDPEAQRLHLLSLAAIDPNIHPHHNPEAAALYCLCNGKGIDVGCGPNKTHPKAIGVDLVAAGELGIAGGVKGCKSVADIRASGDDLHMFGDEELDYVVSRHNLEHYRDPLKALEEWKRVLKPGGILGLVLPDDSHIDTIRLDETHKHVFTPDSLIRIMRFLGDFDLRHCDTCLHQWSFTAVFQKQGGGEPAFDYDAAFRSAAAVRCRVEAQRREANGEAPAALECWREAAALAPDDATHLSGQVRMLRRLGRLGEAEELSAVLQAPVPESAGGVSPRPAFGARHLCVGGDCLEVKSLRRVSTSLPAAPKRILLSYCANPMTTGTYIERALRPRHDVLTWGPCIDGEILKIWNMEALRGRIRPTDLGYDGANVAEALQGQAPGWKPDLFLWVESGVEFPIAGLGQLACPKACYLIDTHIVSQGERRVEVHLRWARQFDVVFLAQRAYVEVFRTAGIDAHWLPLGCDPELHGEQNLKRIHPIGFVGSLNQKRRVDLIQSLQARHPVHVERCFLEDMTRVFSQSRIVFNNAVNGDLNMRVFEAMAAGALVLTDPAPGSGLEDFFTDRKHLAIYRSDAVLPEAAAFWLSNEVERERVARAGRAEVLAHHTYGHRVALLEAVVFGTVAGRQLESREVPEELRTLARALLTVPKISPAPAAGGNPRSPGSPEARMARGRILLSSGKYAEARRWFRLWQQEHPGNIAPLLGLGCTALAGGDWAEGERHFGEALALSPEDAKALCGLGLTLAYSGRETEATDALVRSLAKAPEQVGVLPVLIRAGGAVGRYREVREIVQLFLRRQPDNPQLLLSCAALSARMGESREALQLLDLIEGMDPSFPDIDRWRAAWTRPSSVANF